MVTSSSFSLSHNLPIKLEIVRENLADLRIFGKYHPLIEDVEKVDSTNFIFHEFTPLPFGLKIKFHYPAQIILNSDHSLISYKAQPQGMSIRLSFQLSFDELKQQTNVLEKVEIYGLFLLHLPLRRMIFKSHTQLFMSMIM